MPPACVLHEKMASIRNRIGLLQLTGLALLRKSSGLLEKIAVHDFESSFVHFHAAEASSDLSADTKALISPSSDLR